MKKHLRYISTAKMTREEWLQHRLNQTEIGASDAGTIMGLNPYTPALKLFHQKIGLWPWNMEDNEATYSGRILEDVVAKHYFPYWDPKSPDMETMLKNVEANKVIRKCKRVNSMVKNPDYPWIVVNLDRVYFEGKEECALEIKTGAGFAVSKWESGLPVYYITQHQLCLGVSEMMNGDVGLLTDGRKFDCFQFSFNEAIFSEVVKRTKDFHERVLEGREIMKSDLSAEEKMAAISQFEPQPPAEGVEVEPYEKYMKERFRSDYQVDKIAGTEEMLAHAQDYLKFGVQEKESKEMKIASGNHLRNFMITNNATEIDFEIGSVKWGKKSNGHDNFYVSSKLAEIINT